MDKKKESRIKIKAPTILQKAHEKHETNSIEIKKPKGVAGRKKKPVDQKESETVVLKLTIAEYKVLEKKAGLVKMGTYLKHFLRTETDMLK
jgi:hypothetical protein